MCTVCICIAVCFDVSSTSMRFDEGMRLILCLYRVISAVFAAIIRWHNRTETKFPLDNDLCHEKFLRAKREREKLYRIPTRRDKIRDSDSILRGHAVLSVI